MTQIQNYINDLHQKSEKRFDEFKIVEIDSLGQILDKTYIDKPIWLGGDSKFVCLFIDLDKSSKLSFKKHVQTMAKIYDYFTQNIVDVLNHPVLGADYIDIKGDGAFGIFEGDNASYKALYCAITFKTMFEQKIASKFSTVEEKLSCKFGIHKDKILIRRIGKRGEGNYNEVWAGRLVNNAAKLAGQTEKVPLDLDNPSLPMLISEEVYEDFKQNKEYGFYHCCNGAGENMLDQKIEMFKEFSDPSDETLDEKFYYTRVNWCPNCADNYIGLIE